MKILKPKINNFLIAFPYMVSGIIIGVASLLLFIPPFYYNDNYIAVSNVTLFTILGVFIWIGGFSFFEKKSLENTEYVFTDEKIEYIDNFFHKQRKSVLFSKITDIKSDQSYMQRKFNIGTIRISTAGSIGFEISLKNLDAYEEVYDYIQNKIKNSS